MSNTVHMLELEPPELEKVPGVKPVGYRVLVWPIPTERTTKGGIVIPDILANREDMAQVEAEVLAIGPDCWKDKSGPWCKVGDRVVIGKYSGLLLEGMDGRDYRIVNDIDIVGVYDA